MKLCLVCHFQFSEEMERCPKDNSPLVPLGEDPLIGTVIQDRYKIESIIGKGSMGIVYKATQELIGRDVAVKVLHGHLVSDKEALKRFHQQAKAASRLTHPHIITIYDYGVIRGGQPYIVMDMLSGESLANLLEQMGQLSPEQALPIFKQVASALAEAHKNGVIHRDVKPDNVVIEHMNEDECSVIVVDFGIAKLIQGSDETLTRITKTGTVCGSPAYMSPEQFQGDSVDARSDIYSLATVLFETLTGRIPFMSADLVSLMSMHVAQAPPKLKDLRPELDFPPALERFIAKALSKDPEDRQQSMDEFAAELEEAVNAPLEEVADEPEPEVVAAPEASEIDQVIASRLHERMKAQAEAEKQAERQVKEAPQAPQPGPPPPGPPPGQPPKPKADRSRVMIPWWVRMIGLVQSVFPIVLAITLAGVAYWIVASDPRIARYIQQTIKQSSSPKPPLPTATDYLKAGKYHLAAETLEKLEKQKGTLNQDELQLLAKIYVEYAKAKAADKDYYSALNLLRRVPSDSSYEKEVMRLTKEYQSKTER